MKEVILFGEEIKKVLVGTSPSILQEYFGKHHLFQEMDFEKDVKKGINHFAGLLLEKIKTITPDRLREEVRRDLHKIYVTQNNKFLLPIIRELKLVHDEIIEFIEDSEKVYDQTFIFFLKDADGFRNNYLIYGDGKSYKRWWSVRTDYVEKNFNVSDNMVQKLFDEIKTRLLNEGMGKKYDIHKKSFGGKEQIVIFYQDLPEEKPEMHKNKIDMVVSRPINKIVFLYDKRRRFVKTFNEDEQVRIIAHQAFAKVIFGKNQIAKDQPKNKICKLDAALGQLVSRGEIIFLIKPNLNVTKIIPIATTVKMINGSCGAKIFSQKKDGRYSKLKDSIGNFLALDDSSSNSAKLNSILMSEIEFLIEYRDYCSKKTYRTKRIAMTSKNSISNLGEEDVDFEVLDCFREAQILEIGVNDDK